MAEEKMNGEERAATTPEELIEMAREKGIELSAEDAAKMFEEPGHPSGEEMSDEALDEVNGGVKWNFTYMFISDFTCNDCGKTFSARFDSAGMPISSVRCPCGSANLKELFTRRRVLV